jgi:hypothetical protein
MELTGAKGCKFFVGFTFALDARDVVLHPDGSAASFKCGAANGQVSRVNKAIK